MRTRRVAGSGRRARRGRGARGGCGRRRRPRRHQHVAVGEGRLQHVRPVRAQLAVAVAPRGHLAHAVVLLVLDEAVPHRPAQRHALDPVHKLPHLGVLELVRDHSRGQALRRLLGRVGGGVDVGLQVAEVARDGQLAVVARDEHGRRAVVRPRRDVDANLLHQVLDHVDVALVAGGVQRRGAVGDGAAARHVALLVQELHHDEVARLARRPERRGAGLVHPLGVRAAALEEPRRAHLLFEAGVEEAGVALGVHVVHVDRAVVQHALHLVQVALAARREPAGLDDGDRGGLAALAQHLGGLVLPGAREQRRARLVAIARRVHRRRLLFGVGGHRGVRLRGEQRHRSRGLARARYAAKRHLLRRAAAGAEARQRRSRARCAAELGVKQHIWQSEGDGAAECAGATPPSRQRV